MQLCGEGISITLLLLPLRLLQCVTQSHPIISSMSLSSCVIILQDTVTTIHKPTANMQETLHNSYQTKKATHSQERKRYTPFPLESNDKHDHPSLTRKPLLLLKKLIKERRKKYWQYVQAHGRKRLDFGIQMPRYMSASPQKTNNNKERKTYNKERVHNIHIFTCTCKSCKGKERTYWEKKTKWWKGCVSR